VRRAKIVCTLGPATSSPQSIRALVDAGMDVARFNLSHGRHSEHEAIYRAVREATDASGRGVGVMVDLQGPKIRLGNFAAGPVKLAAGGVFTITTDDILGDRSRCSTTSEGLPGDGRRPILIDDGRVARECCASRGDVARVIEAAPVQPQGHQLPGWRSCPGADREGHRHSVGTSGGFDLRR
jgi:pyruvate kinase